MENRTENRRYFDLLQQPSANRSSVRSEAVFATYRGQQRQSGRALLAIKDGSHDPDVLWQLKTLQHSLEQLRLTVLGMQDARCLSEEREAEVLARIRALERATAAQDLTNNDKTNVPSDPPAAEPAEALVFTRASSWEKINAKVEIDNSYTLAGSVWDCALLMNTKPVGMAGSALALLLMGINVTIQVAFIYMCSREQFTEPEFNEQSVLAYREWRRSVAHSTTFVDAQNSRSLASRVCSGDPGLEVAGAQADVVERINLYLDGNTGVGMAVLCTFIWGLTVAVEIKAIIHFSRCVLQLPRHSTDIELTPDTMRFLSISTGRVCFVLLVQAARMVLAFTLLVSGAQWLAYTTDIPDMLLNAVALEFVRIVKSQHFSACA